MDSVGFPLGGRQHVPSDFLQPAWGWPEAIFGPYCRRQSCPGEHVRRPLPTLFLSAVSCTPPSPTAVVLNLFAITGHTCSSPCVVSHTHTTYYLCIHLKRMSYGPQECADCVACGPRAVDWEPQFYGVFSCLVNALWSDSPLVHVCSVPVHRTWTTLLYR